MPSSGAARQTMAMDPNSLRTIDPLLSPLRAPSTRAGGGKARAGGGEARAGGGEAMMSATRRGSMEARREQPVAVIGAGISGLTCAWRLRREGVNVACLDTSDRV